MHTLLHLDAHDYDPALPSIERTAVRGVIFREGQLLMIQSSFGEVKFPGGGQEAGESDLDTLLREVLEETGLDVRNAKGGYQFSYRRESKGDNYFVDIYRFVMDFDESDVKIQKEEAAGFKLATAEEIKELAKQGIFLHYDSIKQVFEL